MFIEQTKIKLAWKHIRILSKQISKQTNVEVCEQRNVWLAFVERNLFFGADGFTVLSN